MKSLNELKKQSVQRSLKLQQIQQQQKHLQDRRDGNTRLHLAIKLLLSESDSLFISTVIEQRLHALSQQHRAISRTPDRSGNEMTSHPLSELARHERHNLEELQNLKLHFQNSDRGGSSDARVLDGVR